MAAAKVKVITTGSTENTEGKPLGAGPRLVQRFAK